MPDFPSSRQKGADFARYQSSLEPSTQQPSFLAPKNTEGEVIQEIGKVGNTVSDIAVKWGNAVDTIQKTTATANFKSGLADVLNRAQNDPDYNNSDQYMQEIEKLRKDNLRGFSSKAAEAETAMSFGYDAKVTGIQIQNLYRKKMVEVGQVSTLKLLDMEAENPTEGFQERMSNVLNQQVQAGVYSPDAAYKLQKEYEKKGKNNAFLIDLNADPSDAEQNLKNNAYGFDVKELESAKKILESNQKRQEEIRTQTQMATVNEMGEKLANRTLKPEEIQNAIATGLIDADMGLNFQLAVSGPNEWNKFSKDKDQGEKSKILTGLLEKINSNDNAGRIKIVNSALQNYNDKKINADDLTFVLRVANGQSTDPKNPIWGFLQSATDMAYPAKSGAKIMEKFKERWDFKEDPRPVMHKAAIDQYKEEKPETAAYDIGDVIKRKSGSYEVVGFNDDGSPVFRKKN